MKTTDQIEVGSTWYRVEAVGNHGAPPALDTVQVTHFVAGYPPYVRYEIDDSLFGIRGAQMPASNFRSIWSPTERDAWLRYAEHLRGYIAEVQSELNDLHVALNEVEMIHLREEPTDE